MSIIKRYRKECLDDDGIATIYVKVYFLGIPIYEDSCASTSAAVMSQFVDLNTGQIATGFYDTTNIGFKQE